jgi:2-methylcitrate dehydratase PrpD
VSQKTATTEARTLAGELAKWVRDLRFSELPEEIKTCARKTLLNSVGTAIAAEGLGDVGRALEYAAAENAAGPCTIFVTGHRVPLGTGIFVNGVMYNTLGQEETHLESGTHPAETVASLVLGLGEHLGSSGVEVLEAFVIGIEVATAVAHMELTPGVKYDLCEAPAVFGTVGAGAAAARLMKLDERATANAIGLAANFAAGLSECIKVGTAEYHFSVAMASMHGYMAAQLASLGAIAAPTSLEGAGGFYHLFAGVSVEKLDSYDVIADVLGRLNSVWSIDELIFKPYPVNYFNQVYIDGAKKLVDEHGIVADQIEAVRIEVGTLASLSGALIKPPFPMRESVLGNTGFLVAAMLSRGHVTLDDTKDVAAVDILAIFDKTEIVTIDTLVRCKITVTTSEGEFVFDGDVEGRDYRLSEDELAGIFTEIGPRVLGNEGAATLLAALRSIESYDNISELVGLTVAPASRS